jgi:hypothetical protein
MQEILTSLGSGFWVALFAFLTAIVTAISTYLNNLLIVKRRQGELMLRVEQLELHIKGLTESHENCEQERAELRQFFAVEWPSDPDLLIRTMTTRRQAGITATMADVVLFARQYEEAHRGNNGMPPGLPPPLGT